MSIFLNTSVSPLPCPLPEKLFLMSKCQRFFIINRENASGAGGGGGGGLGLGLGLGLGVRVRVRGGGLHTHHVFNVYPCD